MELKLSLKLNRNQRRKEWLLSKVCVQPLTQSSSPALCCISEPSWLEIIFSGKTAFEQHSGVLFWFCGFWGFFFSVSASHPGKCENLIKGAKHFLREQKPPIPAIKGHILHSQRGLTPLPHQHRMLKSLSLGVPRVDLNPLYACSSQHETCNNCQDTTGIWRASVQNCDCS